MFVCLFFALWAPQVKCYLAPLYLREADISMADNSKSVTHTETRWINRTTGKRKNMYFWFGGELSHQSLSGDSLLCEEEELKCQKNRKRKVNMSKMQIVHTGEVRASSSLQFLSRHLRFLYSVTYYIVFHEEYGFALSFHGRLLIVILYICIIFFFSLCTILSSS